MNPKKNQQQNGTQNGENDQDDDETEGLTEERVVGIVNQAVTSHLKRFAKSSSEETRKLLTETLGTFRDEFKATIEESKQQKPPTDDKGEPTSKRDPEVEKRFKALEDQNAQYRKQLEEQNAKAAEAEKRAREEGAYGKLGAALEKVKPELRKALIAEWRVDGKVGFNEDGTPFLRMRKAPAKGMPEEDVELSIDDGVKHWLTTKEAEAWLPAPTQKPLGTPPGRMPPRFAPPQQTNGAPPPFDPNAAANTAAALIDGLTSGE